MTPDQSYKAYLSEYILKWHETMCDEYTFSGENLLMKKYYHYPAQPCL